MSPIIYWIERSFKSRHISRGLAWALHTKVKHVRNLTIFFCSFLCKFFSSLCGNYRRMKWAVALLVWEDKNYSPLLASYFQNEKLFCDILIHLGPHTSPKSCSIQIVFEQKYSFLHDVYLTNIWMWCYSYTSFSCSCR